MKFNDPIPEHGPEGYAGIQQNQAFYQCMSDTTALSCLPTHFSVMLGMNPWKRPIWQRLARQVDGKIGENATFADYLTGNKWHQLNLPSVAFAIGICERSPDVACGQKAKTAMEAQLAREGITPEKIRVQDQLALAKGKGELKEWSGTKGNKNAAKEKNGVDNVNSVPPKGGNASSYLARRLARDHPEIHAKLEAGEFKSVRAAAREVGMVKEKTPLDHLRAWWAKASEEERATFMDEVS